MLLRVLFMIVATGVCWASSPILETKLGSLKGSVMISQLGRQFVAFRGIPYAKPPVGDLRFKLPQPTGSWEGIKDASSDGPICPQVNPHVPDLVIRQEDCLVLNVYIPNDIFGIVCIIFNYVNRQLTNTKNGLGINHTGLCMEVAIIYSGLYLLYTPATTYIQLPEKGDKPLPVMMYIHGGGFSTGSGHSLFSSPNQLLDKNIALVTINYRLGVLGFLSTGDEASSGNWGLHDQVLALKWVRDNIADYGGNPEEITIFGESAGAVSVQYLMLFPELDGAFKRVICQSGTIMHPSLVLTKYPLTNTEKFAKKLNCPTSSSQNMVVCLKTKSAMDLIKAQHDNSSVFLSIDFRPVIEKTGAANAFLTEDPKTLLIEGRFHRGVTVISGVTRDEAAYIVQLIFDEYNNGKYDEHFLDNHLQKVLNKFLGYNSTEAFQRIVEEYMLNVDLKDEEQFKRAFINALSDGFFKAPNDASVRYMSKYITTYMYTFEYRGRTWLGALLGNKDDTSVGHGDDLLYLLNGRNNLTGTDLLVSQKLVKLWTDFATFGDPTPSHCEVMWKPLSPSEIRYLRIADTLTMHQGYRTEQMKFWNEDMKKFKKANK